MASVSITSTKLRSASTASDSIIHTAVDLTLNNTHSTVLCDTVLSTFLNIELPNATLYEGKTYTIKNNGTGFVNVNANFGQLIDDVDATYVLMVQNESVNLQSDGITWYVVG